jgi:hypothetical protein
MGMLSVPVRRMGCTATLLCTTVNGACCRRMAPDRPVAITVTRSWSPRLSS